MLNIPSQNLTPHIEKFKKQTKKTISKKYSHTAQKQETLDYLAATV